MDCLEIKKNLALYLDDLLEGREADSLEAHLLICAACRVERERVERLFAYGAALPAQEPSPQVWERIRVALRKPQPLSWQESLRAWIDRSRETTMHFLPSYAAGAASAALFLFAVFPFGKAGGEGSGLRRENDRPLHQAGLVPDSTSPDTRFAGNGYPVRLLGDRVTAPGTRLVVRDGQLWEVEEPPAQPRVDFPVRDIASPAALRRDF